MENQTNIRLLGLALMYVIAFTDAVMHMHYMHLCCARPTELISSMIMLIPDEHLEFTSGRASSR